MIVTLSVDGDFVNAAAFASPRSGRAEDWEDSSDMPALRAWILTTAPVIQEIFDLEFSLDIGDSLFVAAYLSTDRDIVFCQRPSAEVPRSPTRRCITCARIKSLNSANYQPRGDDYRKVCRKCAEDQRKKIAEIAEKGRRFGVEIEFCYDGDPFNIVKALNAEMIPCIDDGYTHEVLSTWKLVPDTSLSEGWELVSPPLYWDQREQIDVVCEVLSTQGAYIDSTCGLHVHHEVKDLTLASFKRLVCNWVSWQDHTNKLILRERHNSYYASPLKVNDVDLINQADSLHSLSSAYHERFRALNISSYPQYGTVEMRQHHGTLDAQKIITWVAYGQAVVEQSTRRVTTRTNTLDIFLAQLPFRCTEAAAYLSTLEEGVPV